VPILFGRPAPGASEAARYCGRPSTLLVFRDAAGIFAPDLADGTVTLTDEPTPAGVNAQHRCLDCGRTWQ